MYDGEMAMITVTMMILMMTIITVTMMMTMPPGFGELSLNRQNANPSHQPAATGAKNAWIIRPSNIAADIAKDITPPNMAKGNLTPDYPFFLNILYRQI